MRIWNDSIEWHMLQFPLCLFLPNPKGQEGRRVEENTSVNIAMQIKTLSLRLFKDVEHFCIQGS